MRRSRRNKGFTLLETLLAAILGALLLGGALAYVVQMHTALTQPVSHIAASVTLHAMDAHLRAQAPSTAQAVLIPSAMLDDASRPWSGGFPASAWAWSDSAAYWQDVLEDQGAQAGAGWSLLGLGMEPGTILWHLCQRSGQLELSIDGMRFASLERSVSAADQGSLFEISATLPYFPADSAGSYIARFSVSRYPGLEGLLP